MLLTTLKPSVVLLLCCNLIIETHAMPMLGVNHWGKTGELHFAMSRNGRKTPQAVSPEEGSAAKAELPSVTEDEVGAVGPISRLITTTGGKGRRWNSDAQSGSKTDRRESTESGDKKTTESTKVVAPEGVSNSLRLSPIGEEMSEATEPVGPLELQSVKTQPGLNFLQGTDVGPKTEMTELGPGLAQPPPPGAEGDGNLPPRDAPTGTELSDSNDVHGPKLGGWRENHGPESYVQPVVDETPGEDIGEQWSQMGTDAKDYQEHQFEIIDTVL